MIPTDLPRIKRRGRMTQTDRRQSNRSRWSMAGFGGIVILSSVLLANGGLRFGLSSETIDRGPKPTGYPQLVSVEPLPEVAMGGELCAPAPSPVRLAAALRQERFTAQSPSAAVADGRGSAALNRPPVRVIRDPYPTYSAVAVDPKNNEIVLQDENLFQLMVYDRLTNTPATARLSEPKRIISGHDT